MIGSTQSGSRLPNSERDQAEDADDERVAQGVERPEEDRPPLLAHEAPASRALPRRSRRWRASRAGSPAVRLDLRRAAVIMVVRARSVLGLVHVLGGFGGGRGARDVGDRGDVVPVDAVADPEEQRRREQRHAVGRVGDGAEDAREGGEGHRGPSGSCAGASIASRCNCINVHTGSRATVSVVIHDSPTRSFPTRSASELRARGLRWTPQRRAILEVLRGTEGHVTVIELIEQCRRRDPDVTPSTVYRTLETLEELGLVRHSHGVDGREEYHVRPETEHGHLACSSCGQSWELDAGEVRSFLRASRGRATSRPTCRTSPWSAAAATAVTRRCDRRRNGDAYLPADSPAWSDRGTEAMRDGAAAVVLVGSWARGEGRPHLRRRPHDP